MSYKIIEVHQVYKNGKLDELAVLWESNPLGWVRATYCTTAISCGYRFLSKNDVLSPTLVQAVAGQGMRLPMDKRRKYFPGKRNWE